jgi:hypothetical protein
MPETPRNLAWLRSLKLDGVPEFGSRLSELVQDLVENQHQLAQQTNSSLTGNPAPPPPLQSVMVTPTEVGHHVSIVHQPDYRGTVYHVESSTSPNMVNPFPEYTGPAREINLATGKQKLYFQAFASYLNSGNTTPVFHGGVTPTPVTGGKNVPRGTSQGGGTGKPGSGLAGYGPVPYSGSKPPVRGKP